MKFIPTQLDYASYKRDMNPATYNYRRYCVIL